MQLLSLRLNMGAENKTWFHRLHAKRNCHVYLRRGDTVQQQQKRKRRRGAHLPSILPPLQLTNPCNNGRTTIKTGLWVPSSIPTLFFITYLIN